MRLTQPSPPLARVIELRGDRQATAISDAGVNIAAATCIGPGAELHILVPHAEAVRHALAISNLAVSREVVQTTGK